MKNLLALLIAILPAAGAFADDARADATLRLGISDYDDVDAKDTAFGVGLGYRLMPWLAVDAQFSYAPKDLGQSKFSGHRTEGFAGLRIGPGVDGTGVYVAARPGFVKFSGPDEPIACPAIFPPTLTCNLAGRRLFATDLAGGFQFASERGLLRLELGDRLLKYPNPTFGPADEIIDGSKWTHNLAGSVAVGVRF